MQLPQDPPQIQEIIITQELIPRLLQVGPCLEDDQYLHWDEIRRRKPPEGLTHEQWWLGMHMARQGSARSFSMRDKQGSIFTYSLVDQVLEKIHDLDFRAAGRLAGPTAVINPQTRDQYKIRGLIEEAISSSQLEGAVTSRAVAKEMLRESRKPRDYSERMIYNNYQAIRYISRVADREMTPELILELHKILTHDTFDDPAMAGRFQGPNDNRVEVVDMYDTVLHLPPAAEDIPQYIESLCQFANGGGENFTHPLVRAILLHFWLAYIHPFADGNGRTARVLFYWSALRSGYWLTEYISISQDILKAPARYARVFLQSETMENDVTYFFDSPT